MKIRHHKRMKTLLSKLNLAAYGGRILRLVGFLRDPFRLRELAEISEQMNFWHAEEIRTMTAAFAAYDQGDHAEYATLWAQHLNVRKRCKAEVTDRLATFQPNA